MFHPLRRSCSTLVVRNPIKKICDKMANRRSHLLYDEFYQLTRHEYGQKTINLTHLMNKYNITSSTLFERMYNVVIDRTKSKHKKIYDPSKIDKIIGLGQFVGMHNGIQINNRFRVKETDEQIIDIENYDIPGAFYEVIIPMQYWKMDEQMLLHTEPVQYDHTIELIKKMCDRDYTLFEIFVKNTTHFDEDEKIDITKLMDKYNIESYELFYEMITNNNPFGLGFLQYDEQKHKEITPETAKDILIIYRYYVDYFHGIPIKNEFRKNKGEKQIIRIKKFDDRTRAGNFYHCIFKILKRKINKKDYY